MNQTKRFFVTSSSKPIVVFILGGPCSGKGTQSELINKRLNYKHLSAGELLREQRKRPNSQHGQLIQKTIMDGRIVPSHITVSLLDGAMRKQKQEHNKFLIDGFPRNIENLQQWNRTMEAKVLTPFILFLTCSQQTMLNRLKKRSTTSDRSDDNVEVIKKRFITFNEQTLPVVDWYRKTQRVIEVSSQPSSQQIFSNLRKEIEKRQSILKIYG